jgi:hypothetical protein
MARPQRFELPALRFEARIAIFGACIFKRMENHAEGETSPVLFQPELYICHHLVEFRAFTQPVQARSQSGSHLSSAMNVPPYLHSQNNRQ